MKRPWAAVMGGLVVVALAAAVGVIVMKTRGGGEPAPEMPAFEPAEAVEIVEVREISWQPTADLMGSVFALRSVSVRNELAGTVTAVGFDSGEVVEEGQVVLQQDDTTDRADLEAMKAAVRVSEASIASADAEIELATVELERLQSVESRAIAEVELDRARTRLDTVVAERGRWAAEADQARARVAQVEARLAKLTIRSPFRARAGMRTIHPGQYLSEGVEVVMLQELTDRIYIDFAIPQEYAPRVAPGTVVMANAEILGPEPVRIEVVAVDAVVNRDTRNLRVRAIVENPGGVLVPGMFIQVRVPIEAPERFAVVPSTAIRRAAYGNSVFVIAADDAGTPRASQKFITLGETVGEDVIVTEGLEVGDRIAAAGSFKLRDGVKIIEGPPGGPPPGIAGGPEGATEGAGASPAMREAAAEHGSH